MNEQLTDIVFVLDRSGSMGGTIDDYIGGMRTMLDEQREVEGSAKISFYTFGDYVFQEYLRNDISDAYVRDVQAGGLTAMYDGIGVAIDDLGVALAGLREEDKPGKVLFVIVTDGWENCSKEYDQADIKDRITKQTDKYSWEFMFLGANIDSKEVGNSMGVYTTQDYVQSSEGVEGLFSNISVSTATYRNTGDLNL